MSEGKASRNVGFFLFFRKINLPHNTMGRDWSPPYLDDSLDEFLSWEGPRSSNASSHRYLSNPSIVDILDIVTVAGEFGVIPAFGGVEGDKQNVGTCLNVLHQSNDSSVVHMPEIVTREKGETCWMGHTLSYAQCERYASESKRRWGGCQVSSERPHGCYIQTPNGHVHYNASSPSGLIGDDIPVCSREKQ